MTFGDLSQALAPAAVFLDIGTVQYQRLASDVLTFETSAPHAGAHPFDDQAAFKFGDGADDNDGSRWGHSRFPTDRHRCRWIPNLRAFQKTHFCDVFMAADLAIPCPQTVSLPTSQSPVRPNKTCPRYANNRTLKPHRHLARLRSACSSSRLAASAQTIKTVSPTKIPVTS
jgi:hypothetical protein